MRTAFFGELVRLAKADDRIVLLTGDLGFGAIDEFARTFPDRFINAGIAEQNMVGVATGLAMSGKIPFVYSIANFPTLRCLEQIRNGPCYHDANVNVVAVGGGLIYGSLGMTHHATEDIAILRALPNMTVVAPADPVETTALTRALAHRRGPSYLRIGRAGEPVVHTTPPDVQLGVALMVRDGHDLTLISTGGMLLTALGVADDLEAHGFRSRVLSMHTIRPLDTAAVIAAATETDLVVTVEEHSIVGGLGGAVAEVIAEMTVPHSRLKRIGLPSAFAERAGSREYLAAQMGIERSQIVTTLVSAMSDTVKAGRGASS